MKKVFVSLLAGMMLALMLMGVACADGAGSQLIADDAGVLSYGDLRSFENRARQISSDYPYEVAVYFTDSLGYKSAMEYADDYWDYNGYGYGSDHSGILLLVCPASRDYWISTCGDGIDMFDDSRLENIDDDVVSHLRYDDWSGACESFLNDCEYYLEKGMPEKPSVLTALPFCALGGFLFGLAPVNSMKGQLKSVRQQSSARNYVPEGGVRIDVRNDVLVNRLVTRRRIEENNRSSGSGTHFSSSGVSHGGRGGKF